MLEVTLETAIAAPPELAYSVAKEVEKYPSFLPDVKEVTVLERDGVPSFMSPRVIGTPIRGGGNSTRRTATPASRST